MSGGIGNVSETAWNNAAAYGGNDYRSPGKTEAREVNSLAARQEMVDRMRDARSDAFLGAGHMVSTALGSQLPRKIAPSIMKVVAGSGRALGGALTLATSGYRVGKTFMNERKEGSTSYPETRKELFVTSASVTAGMAAGTIGGLAVSGALLVGAPFAAVAGVGLLGLAGVGMATYKGREIAEGIWEHYGRSR